MNLEQLRGELNGLDEQLIALYRRRMDLVQQVARYKIEKGLPVFQPEREQQVLDRVARMAGEEYGEGARMLYTALMDVSKAHQHRLIAAQGGGGELLRFIEEALAHPAPIREDGRVACQGVPGAYSHEAAGRLFDNPRLDFYPEFSDAIEAVESGKADYAVLPIENSSAGSVGAVYDLLRSRALYIVRALVLPVNHCLLLPPDADPEQITHLYSHEQGLRQCAGYLRAHPGWQAQAVSNTAAAAKAVAESGDPHAAAIASRACAGLYGLQVAEEGIQDTAHNFTRFIVVSRSLQITEKADRISLSLTLPHVSGSLYRLISRFALCSLNLTKLESRPLPGAGFHFLFYFDFEGSVRSQKVRDLLRSLEGEVAQLRFLGNYEVWP
ncbi:MAG: prephenate dehydratase [Provencibacterium sp.]|jgi:chorismate mutase/prephenate dehydratase|nr:prephenate dehydratase [Provencibacterium sp.]